MLGIARVAAIMATKRAADLIPLCHPIGLTKVAVDFALDAAGASVTCTVRTETRGQTGVEMEALTGVQVALLTIYDMCKAVDRGMVMGNVRLLEKHGGKSGTGWRAEGGRARTTPDYPDDSGRPGSFRAIPDHSGSPPACARGERVWRGVGDS